MRKPEYMSPTSLKLFYENLDDYYLNYLTDDRPPRFPQTQPMSVGSAFDAYVKADLYKKLIGKADPKFEFTNLFESQVETHNRDWALSAGKHVFDFYKEIGSLNDLLIEMERSVSEPRFEAEIRGAVGGVKEGVSGDIGDIPFLGKPDAFFINEAGAHVILDWKVNGYCSKSGVSPLPGFLRMREYGGLSIHKKTVVGDHCGVKINTAQFLEDVQADWAAQLSIYSWLCGEQVGSQFIAAIDQVVCNTRGNTLKYPELRVAQQRCLISRDFQYKLLEKATVAWEIITSGHIFRDLTREESDARCRVLSRSR